MNRVVNLKISTKGRYALRLMVDLAQCKQGENVALKEVAARQGISLNLLILMSSFHFNFNFRSYVADLMCPVSHSCITATSFESEIFRLDHLSHISYLIGGF
jgi:hypothetical protein